MTTLKQIVFASMLVCALLTLAAAQESTTPQRSSLTITAAAAGERVRITAPSSVVQMRVEVYAASGEKLFDQEIRGGNVFDWHLQDGQAQRLAPGNYVCVVTAKSVSGRLTQKIGAVSVAEKSASVQPAESQEFSAPQAQTIGPVEENSSWVIPGNDEPQTPTVIANDGTDGQMIRGRGALTFRIGNFFSGIDKEQMRLTEAGDLGIGTSDPKARLDVAGTIRAQRFLVARPNTPSSDLKAQAPDDANSVQPLIAGTGTQNRIAKWTDNAGTLGDSGITETAGGFVGIGTTAPGSKLVVSANIATLPAAFGVARFADADGVQTAVFADAFGTNAIFNVRRANGTAAAPSAVQANQLLGVIGASGFGTSAYSGTRARVAFAASENWTNTANGTFLTFNTTADGAATSGGTERMRIDNAGNVGIGTTAPAVQLDVQKQNPSLDTAFQVTSLNSDNVWLGRAATTLPGGMKTIVGQSLMFLGGAGHNGSAFTTSRAGIDFQASQDWTAGANGTRMRFFTANNGSTTGSERMRIEPDGDIGMGTTAPLRHLHVKGASDQEIGIESTDALGQQWTLQSSGAAGFGRFEIINRTAGANRFTISSSGLVGIGTSSPNVKLDVRGDMNVTGNASAGEVALISNQANTDDADLLRLAITGFSSDLTTTNNFITFTHVNSPLGAIQPTGSGGIEIISGSADYAEWLPRINLTEEIQPGEIVGLHGGRVTKQTRGATQVMAVSTGPIVAGNDPGEKARKGYELVAFIGQVPVRVRGSVKSGDFIVASGLDDGTGIAVSPERITTEQFEQVVGQAWEASTDPGVKSVRIAVGLNRRDPSVSRLVEYSRNQTARIAALEARLTTFEAKLRRADAGRVRTANKKGSVSRGSTVGLLR